MISIFFFIFLFFLIHHIYLSSFDMDALLCTATRFWRVSTIYLFIYLSSPDMEALLCTPTRFWRDSIYLTN